MFLLAQDGMFLADLVSSFGPLIGIVLFFIWRDWKREDALHKRVQLLEEYQKDVLSNLVERSTVSLTQNTEILKRIMVVFPHSESPKDERE